MMRGAAELLPAKEASSWFHKAVFDRSAFQTEDLIWVEAGNSSKRADELIFEVMTLAEGLLKQHGF